jgi:hypothetical protein
MFDWLKKEEPRKSELPPLPATGPGLPPLPAMHHPPHKEQVELSEAPTVPHPPQPHHAHVNPEDERVGWEKTGHPQPPHPLGPPAPEHHEEHHAASKPHHQHPEGPRDVYVKIDQFKDAKHALESAQSHIHDINELLKELRKINNEEQEQITQWEHNLDDIKNKVRDVADNIFDKV